MSVYIHRSIESKLNEMRGIFPAILIAGARQSGKSTLLEYLASSFNEDINEVSLDDMQERSLAITDPELFLRSHKTPLIIDEFQYAPGLLPYIKIAVDRVRKKELFGGGEQPGTLYYLTGSQIFETMEIVSESLAGRIGIIDLHPLSAKEIEGIPSDTFVPDIDILRTRRRTSYGSTAELFERIFRGGYPELYKIRSLAPETFFSSYVRTYIERDVRSMVNIQNEPKFMKFISSVAARTGCEYNASDIARDAEVSVETTNKWMAILTNTYLVALLQPHMNNNIGRIVKRPKIVFMDTGLACYLTGYVSSSTLEKSAFSGQIFETWVISEIIKSYSNSGRDPKKHLFYYRDNNKREIDLLIINEDRIYPVEIKKSANPSRDAVKNFAIAEKFEMKASSGTVLCLCEEIHAIDKNSYMVPTEYI